MKNILIIISLLTVTAYGCVSSAIPSVEWQFLGGKLIEGKVVGSITAYAASIDAQGKKVIRHKVEVGKIVLVRDTMIIVVNRDPDSVASKSKVGDCIKVWVAVYYDPKSMIEHLVPVENPPRVTSCK